MQQSFFSKLRRLALQFLTILAPVALLTACGGGGSGPSTLVGTPSTQGTLSVTLTAAANTLNSGGNTTLTATVTDSSGKPVTGQEVTFSLGTNISGATLSVTSATSDGNGKAGILYTAGTLSGTDSIIATVTDKNSKSSSASVGIAVIGGTTASAYNIVLSANPNTGLNSGARATLTATVKDVASGNPVNGATVTFSFGSNLSNGTLAATTATTASGTGSVLYTAGNQTGTDVIIATVSDANGKTVQSSAIIEVSSSSTNPPNTCTNSSYSGSGSKVLSSFTGISGATTFTLNYNGTGNFIVWLKDSTGKDIELLANEIGSVVNRQQSVTLDSATNYFIEVKEGTGAWSIAIYNATCTTAPVSVGILRILSSSNSLGTNDSVGSNILVEVKSANNVLLAGVPVILSADNGSLQIASNTTDATGTISAKLTTAGLYSNGSIKLNASANGVAATEFTIAVSGTTLTLSGPASAVAGDNVTYNLSLKDSSSKGIPTQTVNLITTSGTVPATVTTDVNGNASFVLNVSGNTTVTASALNTAASSSLAISAFRVGITTPANDGVLINIDTPQDVTVTLSPASAGQTVNFSTTRGALNAPSAVTNAAGTATVTITSSNSGAGVITAEANGVTAQRSVVFTAKAAEQIVLQSDPSVVNVNGTSTVTAILRDNKFNIVAKKPVSFTIVQDTSNGTISQGTVLTDNNGRAQVLFTAGSTSTAFEGVEIRATADGTSPAVTTTTKLTVGGQSLFIRLGSSNISIDDSDNAFYKVTYTVIVTDSAGLPVKDAQISASLLPPLFPGFLKGTWEAKDVDPAGDGVLDTWVRSTTATCESEDTNQNGILDANEDTNGNGQLDPGNIASIENAPIVTDATGFATIIVKYAQNYAAWVHETLKVTAKVGGSEGFAEELFWLPYPAARLNYGTYKFPPSANPSPWGSSTSCSDTL